MEPEPKRVSRVALAGGLGATLLAIGAGWLWIERTPIATGYIDEALKARGVPASYTLAAVGFRTQRIENIRIGDPAHPDLTADWAEIELAIGFGGVQVHAVDAGGVRLKGRLIDGKPSFGAIDKLLPQSGGGPFELPDIQVRARSIRIDLDTPPGAIHAVLNGSGGLAGGFRGSAAIASDRLAVGGCEALGARTTLGLEISKGRPGIDGPLRARSIRCGRASIIAPAIDLSARATTDLARWTGVAVVQRGAVESPGGGAARLGGRLGFDASATNISGEGRLFADHVRLEAAAVDRLALEGGYRFDPRRSRGSLVGEADIGGASLTPSVAASLVAATRSAGGTPVGPVLAAWGQALDRASRALDGNATFSIAVQRAAAKLQVERLDLTSRSGARMLVRGERAEGLGWRWPVSLASINASAEIGGGGLPDARISLRQPVPGALLTGSATIAPYRVGDARLALAPLLFGPAPGGGTLATTRLTMDGPLADGRIEGLDLPVSLLIGRDGAIMANRTCARLGFARLMVAGSDIGRSSLPLCPIGAAMFGRVASGELFGGASIAQPRLRGRVGDQPLTMQAQGLSVTVGRPGFDMTGLAIRLGDPATPTRLDIAHLDGQVDRAGLSGRIDDADGRIGVVPILVSHGRGQWTLAGGVLKLGATLDVDDAQTTAPRFNRLAVPDFALTLNGGYITANGTLTDPRSGKAVSAVHIAHSLQSGRGDATLNVDGLRFSKSFQPDWITPLTVGIVANVEGAVAGQGKIVWAGGKVTSSGLFRTEGLNLAAAFGPVTGLKGTIQFTDLLALETAPHQVATIAEVNPGISVTDGVVHYRLLSGQRLAVEDGRWPLAGGTLTLEPTLMDFGQPVERRMLFRIDGLDAATFVQQLEFKNISVTGKFDGVLPIIFDAQGGRIEGGELKVRPGGGTLSYVGDVTNADLGRMARIAFDALKSMRYERLAIDLNGSLDGEIVSKVRFDGSNNAPRKTDRPKGLVARMLDPITRLPFRFNITITAPFRGLVSSAQTFVDPSIVLRNVPIQPQAPAPPNPDPDPIQPR